MRYVITIDQWLLVVWVVLAVVILAATAGVAYWYGSRKRMGASDGWRARALDSLPVGVVVEDLTGMRLYQNPEAKATIARMVPEQLAELRKQRSQMRASWVAKATDDGSIRVQVIPIGSQSLMILQDITAQQRTEASYRRLIYQLSHELLTPLTAIQGHVDYIGSDSPTNTADRRRSIEAVRNEMDRLTRLTSNLLLLSRLDADQPLQLRPTNMGSVAEEAVLQLIERADARNITLKIQMDPQLPRVQADRDAWKQVFLNLIDNAIKYGSEAGNVEIVLGKGGGGVTISVVDDGPGIRDEDVPHIFTEMYRAEDHRAVSGSGLGLTIVQRIVRRHGGEITCTSEVGSGTTFRITLPVK